jgi:hypothetical protein
MHMSIYEAGQQRNVTEVEDPRIAGMLDCGTYGLDSLILDQDLRRRHNSASGHVDEARGMYHDQLTASLDTYRSRPRSD